MRRRRREAGAALVVALGALLILTAIAVGIASAVRVRALGALNDYRQEALLEAARGGVNLARAVLEQDEQFAADSLDEEWAQPLEVELPDGTLVSVVIEDASARLNVNWASKEMLMALPGMTEEMADCLLDWVDADDETRPFGAESDFYQTLDPPYDAANQALSRLDEVLQVKEWTPGRLYRPQAPEVSDLALADLLTVHSGERDVSGTGEARLNLNSATERQIRGRLEPLIGELAVAGLLSYRQQHGTFRSLGELFEVPFAQGSDAVILDEVTVSTQEPRNTVNVNTAPLEVLRALPGMNEELAQAIVDRREGQDGPLLQRGDLLAVVGAGPLRQMIDYVATRSAVFLVTATARPASGRGYRTIRAEVRRGPERTMVTAWQEVYEAVPPLESEEVEIETQ